MLNADGFSAERVFTITNALIVLAFIAMHIVFSKLLKAPTLVGRKVMDKIDGFKMYLETAEEERLNALHPPEKTPDTFEKFLPFAFALGVDQIWSERFSSVLEQASVNGEPYQPRWYSSRHGDFRMGTFGSSLARGFASAVVASSTPPGSSSGSGGGGSSGGGGGGGGGGGW